MKRVKKVLLGFSAAIGVIAIVLFIVHLVSGRSRTIV